MTEQQLSQAEKAIEDLADLLHITEQEFVFILRKGIIHSNIIHNEFPRFYYFISEMEKTFGIYQEK